MVYGTVVSGREERFFRSGKRLFRITIKDETGTLEMLWFHYRTPHLTRLCQRNPGLMVYGRIQNNQGKRQMIHPDVTVAEQGAKEWALGIYPVYPTVKGVSTHTLRSVVERALYLYQDALVDGIPREITQRLGLPALREAVRGVHIPPGAASLDLLNRYKTKYHQRLSFDRFFSVMFQVAYRKQHREKIPAPGFSIPKDVVRVTETCLSFTLTGDQAKAIQDVRRDLRSGRPMRRLLQGDVGCGKTVVAAASAYGAALNGWQVAVMVPTQILARQHTLFFSSLSETMGFRPVLITGALKASERRRICEKIRKGEYNVVIGTQALIQKDLSFARLGLVIIDEQHRFGVRQRALLDQKGVNPHLLVMTATPIPRTLAMTLYADMDVSVIREYPEGHRPVITRLVGDREKRRLLEVLTERMSKGQQAMVVCPVIEGSEETDLKNAQEMYERLKRICSPRFRVGLIHGRLSPPEKDRVMDRFRRGQLDLLVGTTVVEVGIDAPGATVMVIEHPERFGLAQLHQLRGRVGRGVHQGLCLLIKSKGLADGSLSRLKMLEGTDDGFEIAQKDLELRGHGELMGMMQTGVGELDYEEVFRETELLAAAKQEAEAVLASDPELIEPHHRPLRELVQSGFGEPLYF